MSWSELDAQRRALGRVHKRLAETGALAPLAREREAGRLWVDFALASYAENRLGEVRDPSDLDTETRVRWSKTALDQPLDSLRDRKSTRCYWLEREGERVGTLAISRFCLGDFAYAYNVYLRPPCRGRGIMDETLRIVRTELERHGIGLKLETSWTWQRAIRLYLRSGFWLHLWKRDLEFARAPQAPPPVIDVGVHEASVSIVRGVEKIVLARARRDGALLLEHGEDPGLPEAQRHLSWDARTTLSLAIALAGWPLVRGAPEWRNARYSDAVHPEALAYQIRSWESEAAERGWLVASVR